MRLFEGLHAYHQACAAQPFSHDSCKDAMHEYLQSSQALRAMWKHEDTATNRVDGTCIQDAFLFCGRNKESRVSAIEIVIEVN